MTLELLSYMALQGHRVSIYVGEWDVRMPGIYRSMRVYDASYLNDDVARRHDVFITHPEVRTKVWQYVRRMPYVGVVHNVNESTMRSLQRVTPALTIVGSDWTRRHMPDEVLRNGVSVCAPPMVVSQTTRTKFPDPSANDLNGVPGYDHGYTTMINLSVAKGGMILQFASDHLPDHKFLGVMGGHGPQVTDYRSNVTLHEHTQDMAAVYSKTRVLIFPTRSETYGIVVSEAMQHGIPVIASSLSAVREAGGDAAIYINPYDGPSWVEALKDLDDPDQYQHWANKSLERGVMLRQQAKDNLAAWEASLLEVVT
jgi:glycosyltransferase involved in cell wall biosynthesis